MSLATPWTNAVSSPVAESAPSPVGDPFWGGQGLRRAEARMRRALTVARLTPPQDVPVGAVVFDPEGVEIGWGINCRETQEDPLGHAEIMALRSAARRLGSWRLDNCELVVTLEPCTMCAGALLGARIGSIVFGAFEPKTGALGSLYDVVRERSQLHHPQVRSGVLETECASVLREFFERRR